MFYINTLQVSLRLDSLETIWSEVNSRVVGNTLETDINKDIPLHINELPLCLADRTLHIVYKLTHKYSLCTSHIVLIKGPISATSGDSCQVYEIRVIHLFNCMLFEQQEELFARCINRIIHPFSVVALEEIKKEYLAL